MYETDSAFFFLAHLKDTIFSGTTGPLDQLAQLFACDIKSVHFFSTCQPLVNQAASVYI